jgi:hypothetical protein
LPKKGKLFDAIGTQGAGLCKGQRLCMGERGRREREREKRGGRKRSEEFLLRVR